MARVHEIYTYHVAHGLASFEEEPPPLQELVRRRAHILRGGLPYLIAETDQQVVGYCYASLYRTRSAYRFTLEDSIYIDHCMRGHGIGRALLSSLIARCEAGDWRQMVAIIGDTDNTASIMLHEKLGFHRVGTLLAVGFKFGRWVDSVLMQRALGQGDQALPHNPSPPEPASAAPRGRRRG